MKTVWCSEPVMRGLSLPRTNLSSSTGHLPLKVNLFPNLFGYLDKYIPSTGHVPFQVNFLQTYIYPQQGTYHSTFSFCQIHLAIWTNMFACWDKHILQFGEICFTVETNTFCHLNKSVILDPRDTCHSPFNFLQCQQCPF